MTTRTVSSSRPSHSQRCGVKIPAVKMKEAKQIKSKPTIICGTSSAASCGEREVAKEAVSGSLVAAAAVAAAVAAGEVEQRQLQEHRPDKHGDQGEQEQGEQREPRVRARADSSQVNVIFVFKQVT